MSFLRRAYTRFVNLWQRAAQKRKQMELHGESKAAGLVVTQETLENERPQTAIQINVHDTISVSEHVIGHGRGSSSEGICVAGSDKRSNAADLLPDGTILFSIEGKSRQNEEGNDKVCWILLEQLNRDGAHWSEPRDVSKDRDPKKTKIDWEAYDGKRVLKIQITRAEYKQRIWKTLKQCGRVNDKYPTVDEAADALQNAIKAKEKNINDKLQRAEILLALDATETSGQVFGQVVDSFRKRHGVWALGLGFKEIWVVGPTAELTDRLDQR